MSRWISERDFEVNVPVMQTFKLESLLLLLLLLLLLFVLDEEDEDDDTSPPKTGRIFTPLSRIRFLVGVVRLAPKVGDAFRDDIADAFDSFERDFDAVLLVDVALFVVRATPSFVITLRRFFELV